MLSYNKNEEIITISLFYVQPDTGLLDPRKIFQCHQEVDHINPTGNQYSQSNRKEDYKFS
jgi:hypothetical protein